MKLATQIQLIVSTVARLLPKLMEVTSHQPFKIVIESNRQGHVKMGWYKKVEYEDIVNEEQDVMTHVIPENFKYNLQSRG